MDVVFLRISSEAQLKKFETLVAKIIDFEARVAFFGSIGLLEHELIFAAFDREFSLIEAELEAFALSLEGKAMQ